MTTTTVLVPAYKAATFIGDTIAALRSQTFPSFDVIVSIDGPDEETQIVCRQLTASDSRFRIITQPMRLGWVGNGATGGDSRTIHLPGFYAPPAESHDSLRRA